tara:strand:+ start:464 stop:676 length:213 start_codon:yes stop_codon:yes gene_type:complete
MSFIDAYYDDFIDAYINTSKGSDEFLDFWLFELDEEGVTYSQKDLEDLINLAVANGEIEEGEIFLGTRGE